MRVAHLLRKCDPREWGGTETAVKRLLDGMAPAGVEPVIFCPSIRGRDEETPFSAVGYAVKHYRAVVPVWGISEAQRRQLVAVGGNLFSLDLLWKLLSEPSLALIHTHVLNRLGAIGLAAARVRRLPLVVTIHGGVLDLPREVKARLAAPLRGGIEWGKAMGFLLRSRRLLERADAILTCNRREAELLRERYPRQRIEAHPHSVPVGLYREPHAETALSAFPMLRGRPVILVAGRIDPVKNQLWVVEQWPAVLERHPEAILVLAGPCTDEAYGKQVKKEIRNLGLEERVLLTGGLPAEEGRLIGLFQCARAVVVPSVSETFGLVILEAWAAETAVLSTRTSGAMEMIRDGINGRLFDPREPAGFHAAVDEILRDASRRTALAREGHDLARTDYDAAAAAARVRRLYETVISRSRAP
jgi:glycosyltransferase involved in cell wall biosynthesis